MSSAAPLNQVENPKRATLALCVIVFVSGAVLMGIEIAGAKLLAPGFGTSTFVWGSIIGMFMGALAAGYYIGGNLADKRPSFETLAIIVAIAAVWIILLPRFGWVVADMIATVDFGKVLGPLIAAAVLFFLPSWLMGMVSPFSVKLSATSLSGVGGVAGRLYALSTLGSIFGTLLTTFVLIPTFKLSSVLQALGVILLVTAVVCLWLFKTATAQVTRRDHVTVGMLGLLAIVAAEGWAAFPVQPHMTPGDRLIHYEDSAYHEILVSEALFYVDENSPADRDGGALYACKTWEEPCNIRRWLKFNKNIESGIYPYRKEYKNAVTYTDLLHLPVLWIPKPERLLVVGGGGGIVPSQYSRWYGTKVDIAEIDERVGATAQAYFDMPAEALKDGSIKFYYGDGRQTIKRQLPGPYDIIVLDAYSSGGQIPFHLMTWEFLAEVKSKLKPGGVLITNIISGLRNGKEADNDHNADLFLAEYKTLSASRETALDKVDKPEDKQPLFSHLYVFPKVYRGSGLNESSLPDYRNVIIIATDTAKDVDGSASSMEELASQLSAKSDDPKEDEDRRVFAKEDRIKVDLWPHVRNHKNLRSFRLPNPDDLKNVPIMTDNYAPVDLMYRPVRKDEEMRRVR